MSLAPLKGIRGCWGMGDVAGRQLLETIGPACALHAPVRQDGLDLPVGVEGRDVQGSWAARPATTKKPMGCLLWGGQGPYGADTKGAR